MPTVTLSPIEAKLASLAMQKKAVAVAVAEQAFAADVALIASAHEIPGDVAVSFHVEPTGGTVCWPDSSPAPVA